MIEELNGVICELLTEDVGIILGEDHEYYLFSISDLMVDFPLKTGIKVIFKPVIKRFEFEKLNRAIMIEKTT